MPPAVVEMTPCFFAIVMLLLQSLASLAAYTSRTETPRKTPKSKLSSFLQSAGVHGLYTRCHDPVIMRNITRSYSRQTTTFP
ncbi:MAG: hypothetical protein J3Q66DRAFT_320188 [Benniella sp.]|nr:MAG: hypothetical protein J3Q66DRAFT_320188 [Benniella sp.]